MYFFKSSVFELSENSGISSLKPSSNILLVQNSETLNLPSYKTKNTHTKDSPLSRWNQWIFGIFP